MHDPSLIGSIVINDKSSVPKFIQVKNAIIKAVRQERIKPDAQLPSINEMSYSLNISRDTVERGYRQLKKSGIIDAVPGKGF